MLMPAVAYKLRKYLKFNRKMVARMIKEVKNLYLKSLLKIRDILSLVKRLNLSWIKYKHQFQGLLKTVQYILSYKINKNCIVQPAQRVQFIGGIVVFDSSAHLIFLSCNLITQSYEIKNETIGTPLANMTEHHKQKIKP